MDLKKNQGFSLKMVELRDAYMVNAFQKEVQYLCSFDTDRLLAGFRETAGISMRGALRYPGWESMLIGGHTLGHFMTACVKAAESANCIEEDRQTLTAILQRLTDGLAECQEAGGNGFLFGALILEPNNPEQQFDMVERNQTNIITQAWVPWYTMHKTIEGLVSVCRMEDVGDSVFVIRQTALKVLQRLGDWVYERCASWSEETHRIVLGIEYGGMNDCMYDVYLLTKDAKHLAAAEAFDEVELFEKVCRAKAGENVLNNHHANTTIPKFMGALKRYVVTGEEIYYQYALKFWELVTGHHTYVTGGNSEWEHFGEDDVLDGERTNCNCETCNSYNMLKMTKLFFEISGDVRFADWYEKTLINSVLSSQNPKTGMTTYFQPMASGYHKVYGEPFTKFWCCTGTGMENFTKLQESFFFRKGNCLIVNQYFSSAVRFAKANFELEADLLQGETVTMKIGGGFEGDICFRLPVWLAKEAYLEEEAELCIEGGYMLVKGPFAAGSELHLHLPMTVQAHALPDGGNTYAFTYGPFVLSALLGTADLQEGVTGVDVTVSQNRLFETDFLPSGTDRITIKEGDVQSFIDDISSNLVRSGDAFLLRKTDAGLQFVPHFSQHKERYGIYFRFVSKDDMQFDDEEERRVIDTVQPGYGQYENDAFHSMKESGTGSVGKTQGGTARYAKAGGSFAYTMEVNPDQSWLKVILQSADAGKTLRILINGVCLKEVVAEASQEEFQEIILPIPKEILGGAERKFYDCRERKVCEITFASADEQDSAAVCNFLYTLA